jgi:hypothetical protein
MPQDTATSRESERRTRQKSFSVTSNCVSLNFSLILLLPLPLSRRHTSALRWLLLLREIFIVCFWGNISLHFKRQAIKWVKRHEQENQSSALKGAQGRDVDGWMAGFYCRWLQIHPEDCARREGNWVLYLRAKFGIRIDAWWRRGSVFSLNLLVLCINGESFLLVQ